jgi:hypothetical protein
MSEAWSVLLGTLIGATAGIGVAWLSASLQYKFEHRRWVREQKKKAYTDALRSLSAATIIPIGINLEEIKEWFSKLVEVRESLIVLQVYASREQNRLAECSRSLFHVISNNDFSLVAIEAAALSGTKGDLACFILSGIHNIDVEIHASLELITTIAKLDLEKAISA